MRKNDAGLTILERGDLVRVGKGRVHWVVIEEPKDGYVDLVNPATERLRFELEGNVSLVQDVRDTDEWKAANAPKEEPVEETSAYAKAVLFALNKLQKHVYAGTVSKTKKAKTRKLNRRQKASRKANR